jgi:hypothetical protein
MPKALPPPTREKRRAKLTELERRVVKAKLAHPDASNADLCAFAGMPHKTYTEKLLSRQNIGKILRRPLVQSAIRHPATPPTVNGKVVVNMADPAQAKEWLRRHYVEIVEDVETPQSERIRALGAIMEMTPGARAPLQTDNTHSFSIEEFVERAGGRPSDAPRLELSKH